MELGGDIQVTHAMLRVLGVLEPNWATRVELAARIDLDTGRLGLITGDKGPLACTWLENHPFTGAQVLGRLVPNWDAIKAEAIKAHRACGVSVRRLVVPHHPRTGWSRRPPGPDARLPTCRSGSRR